MLLILAIVAAICASSINGLATISVKGAKFFQNGQQFFLKGVAYQGTPQDPLLDGNQCALDAALMKSIGTNSIRVYHVDPTADHISCMSAFEKNDIYVWVDLSTFSNAIYQDNPTWNKTQFLGYTDVMDKFHSYDNLGGFFIGNEVVVDATGSSAAPYVKAAVADMKAYLKQKDYRNIPIGYSAADIAELRPCLQDYLACGDDATAIDFFGLNSYEWCGDATYQSSGYPNLQAMAANYSIPIIFSETGCNVGASRTFADQAAIFGPDMVGTWSGSIVYEWVQEANNYGLVNYPNGQIYSGQPTPISPDFENLKNQWSSCKPTGVASSAYTPSNSAPSCPASTAGGWQLDGNFALPTLGAQVVSQMAASVKPSPTAVSASTSVSTTKAPGGTHAGSDQANIQQTAAVTTTSTSLSQKTQQHSSSLQHISSKPESTAPASTNGSAETTNTGAALSQSSVSSDGCSARTTGIFWAVVNELSVVTGILIFFYPIEEALASVGYLTSCILHVLLLVFGKWLFMEEFGIWEESKVLLKILSELFVLGRFFREGGRETRWWWVMGLWRRGTYIYT